MTYFIYLKTKSSVPHMEPLEADNPISAASEAMKRLRDHSSAVAAEVYQGDTRIAVIGDEQSL